MSNIGIIGCSGFLGSYLQDYLDAVCIEGRFGWQKRRWKEVAERYKYLDTIVILARSCRKEDPRRDVYTMTKEVGGMAKIVQAFHDKKIIYASSKVVHLGERSNYQPISRHDIATTIETASRGHMRNMIINLPSNTRQQVTIVPDVATHDPMAVYAMTKICGELLVKSCCKDYTILRIWDITQ
jgi:nucleoside-diphosphate-sugar epimerase